MRITFLSWRDTGHPDGGGSEVYIEQIAAELARRGHTVTVHCARYPGSAPSELRDGIRFLRRGGRLTVYLRGLAHLLGRGRREDVVVDVINGLPFLAPLVRRHGVVALTHHVHREQWQLIYPGLAGRIGWFVESRVVPMLYRSVPHVTVSESTRRDLGRIGFDPESITMIRNGTPRLPAPAGSRSPTPTVCVLSRLVPHKQIEHAIAAVGAVRDVVPEVRLDVIGEGWWRDELAAEIRRQGLEGLVRLHGWADAQTKADLLAHAWLMVFPSIKEGWGIAVMEAASLGTPTIAYASAGGVRESIVDGITGVLVEDQQQLAESMRRLLVDHQAREALGEAARERAATFTWERAADDFEAVLRATRRRR